MNKTDQYFINTIEKELNRVGQQLDSNEKKLLLDKIYLTTMDDENMSVLDKRINISSNITPDIIDKLFQKYRLTLNNIYDKENDRVFLRNRTATYCINRGENILSEIVGKWYQLDFMHNELEPDRFFVSKIKEGLNKLSLYLTLEEEAYFYEYIFDLKWDKTGNRIICKTPLIDTTYNDELSIRLINKCVPALKEAYEKDMRDSDPNNPNDNKSSVNNLWNTMRELLFPLHMDTIISEIVLNWYKYYGKVQKKEHGIGCMGLIIFIIIYIYIIN